MSKTVKILLVVASATLAVGLVVGTIGYLSGGLKNVEFTRNGIHVMNMNELGELTRVDQSYETLAGVNIDVNLLQELSIKTGDGYALKAQNYKGLGGITTKMENGVLSISSDKSGRVGLNWGVGFWGQGLPERSYIELTVPEDALLDKVHVKADIANVDISNLNAKNLDIDVDMSNVNLRDLNSETLTLRTNMGNVDAQGITTNDATMNSDLGNIELTDFSAKGLNLKNNLGSVTIDGILEGQNVIKSDSGEVHLTLNQSESETFWEINTEFGSVKVNNKTYGGMDINSSGGSPGAPNTLKITTSLGDVKLNFTGK